MRTKALMIQPLFDFDLKRVSHKHYITGKAAINFPHPGSTTGGWHFLSYFDRDFGVAKVSLAGIHYPDPTDYFGDLGITDVTDQLPAFSFADYGMYGELVVAPVHALVKQPAGMTSIQAAATWMKYVTAYGALVDIGNLQKGETVLIRAASSSVGLAAIQMQISWAPIRWR